MNNVVLSPNVKEYFVNALKGLGFSTNGYSETDIVDIIDNPNITMHHVYELIKCSVLAGLGFDADAKMDRFLQKNTVFNRQIAKGILKTVSNNSLSDDACNTFLRNLTASGIGENGEFYSTDAVHLNLITETVIETLKQGLVNQKLTKAEKLEAETIWRRIKHAKFEQWLINTNNYQANDFELWILDGQRGSQTPRDIYYSNLNQEYRYKDMRGQMVNATKTLLQTNDDNSAMSFLNTPIQGDVKNQLVAELKSDLKKKLKVDRNLLERSAHFWRERCKVDGIQQVQLPNNGNPKNVAPDDVEVKDLLEIENNGLTLIDVLAAAGDYQTQIVTFFQTRSKVQLEEQADPQNGVKKKNKIGNLMGEAGRDYVKKETGTKYIAVGYDVSGFKSGKGGPWKGLKELYQKVSISMHDFWEKLPAVSFVGNILKEYRGYSLSAGTENKDKEKDDDVSEEEQLKELFASDYEPMPAPYAGTLAENFYQKTKARLLADKARVARYQAEIADYSVDAKKFNACKVYLEKRITAAEDALNKIPDKNSPRFNDQTYYDDLEKEIMAAGIGNYASAQDQGFVQDFLNHNQNNTQNDEMVNALKQFKITQQNQTENMQKAKREIATLMFGMQKKVENGQINDANLDNMTSNFFDVNNGHYQKVKIALQGNAQVTLDDVMERMNKFAIGELHDKIFNKKSDRYSSIQYGKQFNQAAKEELTDLGMTI